MNRKYDSLYERLIANTVIPEGQSETTGCWIWTGTTCGKRWPYPRMSVRVNGKHKTVSPLRIMAELFRDPELPPPDPDTETRDHLCDETLCINPDHGQWKTRAENTALMQSRRRNGVR